MIYGLSEKELAGAVGNREKNLSLLKLAGINIPAGFVLDFAEFDLILQSNTLTEKLNDILKDFQDGSCAEKVDALLSKAVLPESSAKEISARLQSGRMYTVCISEQNKAIENGSRMLRGVAGKDVPAAIIDCYKSIYSPAALEYCSKSGLLPAALKPAVIVQEVVDAEKTGKAFTINPVTGNDKEIVVEIGLSSSGNASTEKYIYNWYSDVTVESGSLLEDQKTLMDALLGVQVSYGYPCEVTFILDKQNTPYILDTKPITEINCGSISPQWVITAFKGSPDSATTFFNWSLFEFVWDHSFRRFVSELKLLDSQEVPEKISEMFFGHSYWNLTVAKKAISKVPGYREIDFDNDFAIPTDYEGEGDTTPLKVMGVPKITKSMVAYHKAVKSHNARIEDMKREMLGSYDYYHKGIKGKIEDNWRSLVYTDYFRSENAYFLQVYLDMIHKAMNKGKMLKHMSSNDYNDIIRGLDNPPHIRTLQEIQAITRAIRRDGRAAEFWEKDIEELLSHYQAGETRYSMNLIRQFISNYGYHSEKEFDVTAPCHYETPEVVIEMCKKAITSSDRRISEQDMQVQKYRQRVAAIDNKGLIENIENLRETLSQEEDFKDMSLRFYYLIRRYTLLLAKYYTELDTLEQEEDIWHLKIQDIFDFIDKKINGKILRDIVIRNKNYYLSFRNFSSETKIGKA